MIRLIEVVLAGHEICLHNLAVSVSTVVAVAATLILLRVAAHASLEEDVVYGKLLAILCIEHIPMLLALSNIFILLLFVGHVEILTGLCCLVEPHLGNSLGEFLVHWNADTCALLDQDYAVVEMISQQGYAKRSIPVYVFALELGATLNDVQGADCRAALRSVVERRFEPLIWHFNLKVLDGAERRHCLNRVNRTPNAPVLDLDEGIVQGHAPVVVPLVDIDSQVDQELLRLKCRISRCTGHVHCEVKQVPLMVINFVDIGADRVKSFDLSIFSANQRYLESKDATLAHLVDVCALFAQSLGNLVEVSIVKFKERRLVSFVRVIDICASFYQKIDCRFQRFL